MSGNPESIGELFEVAIALERAAETLYRELEKMFSHYPEVSLFWKSYAEEEDGHAAYLERTRGRMSSERLSGHADITILQKAQECLEKTSPVVLAGIQTLEDAYQLATELKNSEVNTIFEFMIENFSTDEWEQSQFLQAQLKSHVARLENDFPDSYKSKIARQNIFVLA